MFSRMSSTQELDSPALRSRPLSEELSPFSISRSPFEIREVPVVLRGLSSLPSGLQATLHYERLHIEGLLELIPEVVELDITSVSAGGAIRIDQIPLPPCCEVIGVWFTNPAVTVTARA
jgi:hypothetical protein